MHNAYFHFAEPKNEPVLSYAPGTPEREALKKALKELKSKQRDIPMYIGGKEVHSGAKQEIRPPHETAHLLGHFHVGDESHVNQAIEAALHAREKWAATPWEQRAGIFLKAAELLAILGIAVGGVFVALWNVEKQSKQGVEQELQNVKVRGWICC